MASLSGQNPSATFGSLIKSINNLAVSGTLVQLSDGNGNALPISVSTVNVSISSPLTASIVYATNNGNGTNFKIGDDAWIGDVNLANTLQVKGQQDGTKGYVKFTNFAAGPVIGAASSSILELTGSLSATENLTANNLNLATAVIVAANATSSLSATSPRAQVITGTTNHTVQLPNATTLATGSIFYINNNTTSGSVLVKNGAGLFFNNIPWGGNTEYVLLTNATAAGTWDSHAFLPSATTWGHEGLNFQGTITATTTADNQVTATFNGYSATQTADLLDVYTYSGGTKAVYVTAGGVLNATQGLTASIVSSTNNGSGTNFQVGDDTWIGDVNISNTLQVKGQQDGTKGFIKFGSGSNSPIVGGVAGTNVLQVTGSVNISSVLSLAAQNPLPAASSVPNSFAVSASTPTKPYFSDGTNWNPLY